jgi:hypothetical protein
MNIKKKRKKYFLGLNPLFLVCGTINLNLLRKNITCWIIIYIVYIVVFNFYVAFNYYLNTKKHKNIWDIKNIFIIFSILKWYKII